MNRILYVQYTNPASYPPLAHSARLLADAGWDVLLLGTGTAGSYALRLPPHPRVCVRRMRFRRAGLLQKLHYALYVLWVLGYILLWRPRWVYASDVWACLPAWLAGPLVGWRVVYHEHDSPVVAATSFQRLMLWFRRALGRRAAACVLPNRRRGQLFAEQTGRADVLCIWNVPARCEAEPAAPGRNGGPLRLYYHGNLSPELVPLSVLKAVAQLAGAVRLTLVGYEVLASRGYIAVLMDEARRLGIERLVDVRPAVPRQELWAVCQACDVGLAAFPPHSGNVNLEHLAGASNKPFDYLACGLALLVSDQPTWRALYVEPGYGLACRPDEAESIAAALRWYVEHPAERRAMGEAGRQRVLDEWNYDEQFAPVRRLLTRGFPVREN